MKQLVGVRLSALHVIVNVGHDDDGATAAAAVLAGGATVMQVRAKGLTDRAHLRIASHLVTLCRQHGAICLVNDRVDIALAAAADGVHLGDDDLPVAVARQLVGPDLVVGATARNPATAGQRVAEGADYLGVGPIWPTTTKSGLPAALGVQALDAIAAAVDVPVIAIGGVSLARVPELRGHGVRGAAVIGAVAAASDPSDATRQLIAALQTHVGT